MKFFAPVMAIIIGAVSCSEADVEDVVADLATSGTVLYASTGATQTKVTFKENAETEKIDLEWEVDDVFTIYNSANDTLGTFKCTDAKLGKFVSDDVTLEDGVEYTAKYNDEIKSESVYSQNGDEIDELDNACQMETTFKYGTDATIVFGHTMAVMTFKFTSDACPSYLVFENGDESYTVTYTYIEPEGGIYTSYIMINPCEGVERTLTFSLFDSNNKAYDIRTVETSKAYTAGYRYTASVSDLDNIAWSGAGTEDDPYQITTAAQLRLLATNVNAGTDHSGEYFEMTNDIDLGGEDNEFAGIGKQSYPFKGTFDGGGNLVSGLYINSTTNSKGLFGYINAATVKNIRVSGSVAGTSYIGGVVGWGATSSTVTDCYSNVTVTGSTNYIGGVVGQSTGNSTVANCYNEGSVTYAPTTTSSSAADTPVGGIVGYNYGSTVINCYNRGAVKSTCIYSDYIGGIVGRNINVTIGTYYTGSVVNCYNAGTIETEVASVIGGVVGYNGNSSVVSNCYFDSDNYNGDAVGDNSTTDSITQTYGYSTTFMTSTYFTGLLNNGAYSYNESEPTIKACAWEEVSGSYPTLDMDGTPSYTYFSSCTAIGSGTEDDPYIIITGAQLRDIATTVNNGTNTYSSNYFKMTCDIDLGGSSDAFTAIGTSSSKYFSGIFDGGGYEVSGLYISKSTSSSTGSYQGLFGYASGATIKNLGVSGSVTGCEYIGGIVGFAKSSSVSNCYGNVTVKGGSYYVGGIVGSSTGSVSNCYNIGSVSGFNYVGGIVGSPSAGSVSNCYNTGSVSGTNFYVGGVVGRNSSSANTDNCYNTGTVSLSSTSKSVGGIAGYNDGAVSNCIYDSSVYSGSAIGDGDGTSTNNSGSATLTATMTNGTFSSTLGTGNWKEDYTSQINDGYPILIWQ